MKGLCLIIFQEGFDIDLVVIVSSIDHLPVVQFKTYDENGKTKYSTTESGSQVYNFVVIGSLYKGCSAPNCSVDHLVDHVNYPWLEECLMDLGVIDGRFCDEEKKYYAIVYTTRSPNKRKCNNDDAFGDDTFTNSTGVNYGGTGYAYTMISVCAPRKNDDLIIGTSSNKLRILDYLTQDGKSLFTKHI